MEHLTACHRRIEDRLATLERAIPVLQSKWTEASEAIANVLRFFDSDGVLHTADEEVSLFPRLRSKATGEETAFFEHLETDHDAAEAIYAGLKAVVQRLGSRPADAAALVRQVTDHAHQLCDIYRRRIQEEETRLIPIARQRLSGAELADIAAEMKTRRSHRA